MRVVRGEREMRPCVCVCPCRRRRRRRRAVSSQRRPVSPRAQPVGSGADQCHLSLRPGWVERPPIHTYPAADRTAPQTCHRPDDAQNDRFAALSSPRRPCRPSGRRTRCRRTMRTTPTRAKSPSPSRSARVDRYVIARRCARVATAPSSPERHFHLVRRPTGL